MLNLFCLRQEQLSGITFSEVVRVRADRTDLNMVKTMKSSAGHGSQAAIAEYTFIVSECYGSRSKGPGLVSLVSSIISGISAAVSFTISLPGVSIGLSLS